MRHSWLVSVAFLTITGGSAQTRWHHELLLAGSDFYLGIGVHLPGTR